MNDHPTLLHNMSAPPKSVIKYAGLSGLVNYDFNGGGRGHLTNDHEIVFGNFVAFRLPEEMRVRSASSILNLLGHEAGRKAEKTLIDLIERRAMEFKLPDGCLVRPWEQSHRSPWPDPLAALAILTKSSANVWLRGKTPSLSSLAKRKSVSLLLPPAFAARVPETAR
jgi:hypothetical protein